MREDFGNAEIDEAFNYFWNGREKRPQGDVGLVHAGAMR